ncbi:MAG: alpha-L-rhamnosidase C-terminal domain-containing protein, partial [Pseudomonadales bacterium]
INAQLQPGQHLCVNYHLDLPGLPNPAADSCTGNGGAHQHNSLSVLRRFQAVTLSGDIDEAQLPSVCALEQASIGGLGLNLETDSQPLAAWHSALASDLEAGCAALPRTGQDLEAGLSATADLAGILDLLGRCQGAAPLLRSWAQDLMDAEARRGNLPRVVPAVPGESILREAGSTEALVLTVWSLYRHFGDLEMVDVAYSAVARLLRVMHETAPDHIRWYSVPALESQLPADLVGTGWFYRSAMLAAELAGVLGKTEDQTHFALLAEDIRSAFRRRFVTAEGAVVSRTQSALCLALGGGLLDLQERPMAIASLVASVRQEGLRVQTGQLPMLLQILSRNGHLSLALSLVSTESGCAQFTENYGRSMVAAGALEWIYGDLLGLRLPNDADLASGAFRHLLIEPSLPLGTEYADALGWTRIAGSCQTIRGEIRCGWRLVEDGLVLTVELPVDTTAQLQLPGRAPELLSAGPHERLLQRSELPDDGIPKLLDARVDSPRRESLRYPRAS